MPFLLFAAGDESRGRGPAVAARLLPERPAAYQPTAAAGGAARLQIEQLVGRVRLGFCRRRPEHRLLGVSGGAAGGGRADAECDAKQKKLIAERLVRLWIAQLRVK